MTRLETTSALAPVPAFAERPRLLLVDDDHTQLRALERLLRRHVDRVDYAIADNGIDALLKVGIHRPALVVMDVHMPGLDGVEACRRLKANPETASTNVILASALMTPALRAEALEAGASRAIAKPIDLASLLDDLELPPLTRPALGTVPPPLGRTTTRRAANVLVDQLVAAGVEVVFGLPGGPISPIHDALIDSKIRVVTTRHESGAMFAAAGYAHTTGKLGVAIVTSGPGVLNAVTGLASAWCDSLPVLVLAGEAPRGAHGKGVLQDGSSYGLNIVGMTTHVTKLAMEVPSGTQLPHLVKRAITTALSGRRGPVLLTLPMDVTTAVIDPPAQSGMVALANAVPDHTLDEVVALLRQSARPLILAGAGVRGPAAPAALRVLAERLGCPVATTPKGKGVFPESHPLALGVFGLGGHPSARAYVDASPDVILAVGTSLGDLSTDGFAPQLQAPTLIHVDIDGRQLGKSYAPSHGIVAGAAEVLAGLAERLPPAPVRTAVMGVERHALGDGAAGRIAPQQAIAAIQQILPADTIYTIDSGEHFLFATHYLELDHPDAFVVMTGLGSMGQSIGGALGARIGHPGRVVASIVGDGCFAMNAFEVATAAAEQLPLRVFVFNDARLGMVEIGHEAVYGRRPAYPTDPLDVCRVAAGLGAATVRVTSVQELHAAAELIRDHRGPVVVDVCIDPAVKLPKKDRMGAFAPATPRAQRPRLLN